jgi:Protein of unknown function (DUF2752)
MSSNVSMPVLADRNVRLIGAGAFAVAAVWPLFPVHPPAACPLRSTTGIPCPFCGMTRAVVAAVHGDMLKSLAFNPAGILIVAIAIAVLIRPSLLRIRPPIWLLAVPLGALWLWNIGFNPTFHQLLWH